MPDATIALLCSDATYNIEAVYITLCSKNVKKKFYISARLAQSGAC